MVVEPGPSLHGGDLLEAARRGSTVYVVEGPTDVKAGQSAGLAVVCAPLSGGGGWHPDFTEELSGFDVICVQSRGYPSSYGPVKWRGIAREITKRAARVRLLEFPTIDGETIGDLASYLQRHSPDAFAELAESDACELPRRAARSLADGREVQGAATPPAAEGNWDEPVPLDRDPDPPPFPTETLPGWMREFVEAIAEAYQVPRDLPGALALAVLALASAGPVVVDAAPDWREPLNLFVAVAMDPGERKSGVFREMTAPMTDYERAELSRMMPEIAQAASRRRQAEARVADLEKAAATTHDDSERRKLTGQTEKAVEERDQIVVPQEPQRFTSDVTPEKLGSLLAAHDGRFGVLSPEGGVFDQMAGLYTKGQPNPDVFLKAHAGDTLRVDRGSRPSEFVERPTLTLCLAVQPASLAAVRANPALRNRGLLERLLMSVPRSIVGQRQIKPPPVPPSVRSLYAERLKALARSVDQKPMDDPLVLRLSAGAGEYLDEFRRAHEPRCGPDGDLAGIKGWASKLPGAAVRIVGLLHLADHLTDGFARPIERSTMQSALKIAEYFTAHALRAFDLMDADPRVPDAAAVLAWVQGTKPTQFKVRDAYRALRTRFSEAAPVRAACKLLDEHGYLREIEEPPRRGRPSPAYEVNPAELADGGQPSP